MRATSLQDLAILVPGRERLANGPSPASAIQDTTVGLLVKPAFGVRFDIIQEDRRVVQILAGGRDRAPLRGVDRVRVRDTDHVLDLVLFLVGGQDRESTVVLVVVHVPNPIHADRSVQDRTRLGGVQENGPCPGKLEQALQT